MYKLTRGQDARLGTGEEPLRGQWEDSAWEGEPWSSGSTQQQPLVTDWIWAVNEGAAGAHPKHWEGSQWQGGRREPLRKRKTG